MNNTKQAKCTLSPASDAQNIRHSEEVTKQGEACKRSGWIVGVRGLEAISGQKLGGFRALWLPLFAPLIECHGGRRGGRKTDGFGSRSFATVLIPRLKSLRV